METGVGSDTARDPPERFERFQDPTLLRCPYRDRAASSLARQGSGSAIVQHPDRDWAAFRFTFTLA